jgi:hypothetical protein
MGAPAGRGAAPSGGFPAGRPARAPLAAVLPARPVPCRCSLVQERHMKVYEARPTTWRKATTRSSSVTG